MKKIKIVGLVIFSLFFIAAGINHFLDAEFYLKIMPPYLPWHLPLVWISGVAETALGVLLLIRRTRRWAAFGLVALLIAVFPANLHMAMNPDLYPTIPVFALWLRLPVQGLLIFWAYAYSRSPTARTKI